MVHKTLDSPNSTAQRPAVVPNGAPTWVTPELIADTLDVWQPYYQTPLTVDDALEMLLGAANLLRVLATHPAVDRE